MKRSHPPVSKIIFVVAVIAVMLSSSCTKGDPARAPLRSNLPIIDSIVPKTGAAGTEVTIYGKNLGNSASVITVNGKPAINKSPSDTRFVITVADTSSTGPVIVKNSLGQSTTGPVFSYILTTSYTVSTFAGDGTATFADGTGTAAKFNGPSGITIDAAGNLYVADTRNQRIRKITVPAAVVTTIAGTGVAGIRDGAGSVAWFNNPVGLTVDGTGNVYVADQYNHRIRKITPAGSVTTFAGTGVAGSTPGPALFAQFSFPEWIIIDKLGNFYVSELSSPSPKIRSINTALVVSTLAGGTAAGAGDGTGVAAQFNNPQAMALDQQNAFLYVADYGNHKIRRISIPGAAVTSPIGNGTASFSDGTGTSAGIPGPVGMVTDPSGNLYVTDFDNNRVRKVLMPQLVVSTLAGNASAIFADGNGTNATFKNPYGIVTDLQGNFYVVDQGNNKIRKMAPYTH